MKNDYKYLFFDLDGTLTDSAPGIMNGFRYAIGKMGLEIPEETILRKFVGPPLSESFEKGLGLSKEDSAAAIAFYREYYFKDGVFENVVYPGIPELLEKLKERGKILAVATSKLDKPAMMVLDHFGLTEFFTFISTTNDKDITTKKHVIERAISSLNITDFSEAVMIGDRFHDISAAKEVGIDSIGVLFGYGDRPELENAGATHIAENTDDIFNITAG